MVGDMTVATEASRKIEAKAAKAMAGDGNESGEGSGWRREKKESKQQR